eukprot:COSAG02_NODE_7344_length_3054_cov_221.886294_1_plen_174_part_00
MHGSTQHSWPAPQPYLPAAFRPGRTFSTTSTRTQQQRTSQNERLNASRSQTRLKSTARDRTRSQCTKARNTLRPPFSYRWWQLLSRAGQPSHHLHADTRSKHATTSAQTPRWPDASESGRDTPANADNARTHARAARRPRLSHRRRQLASLPERASNHLHTRGSRDTSQNRGR